jgi:cytoskeletal protein RodZ
MSIPEREGSMQSSIPPPPPPPLDDSNYLVRHGNGADTYTNNLMADDESVEAQHVVYTFAEEGKSSKKGRKKWICLMLTVSALLVVIITLGAVYGTQRVNRVNSANSLRASEANKANANKPGDNAATDPATENTVDTSDVDTSDVDSSDVDSSTIDVDGVDTSVDPNADADVYDTPAVDANSTIIDENATAPGDTTTDAAADNATLAPTTSGTSSGTSSGTRFVNQNRRPCNRPNPPPFCALKATAEADATIAPTTSGTSSGTSSGTLPRYRGCNVRFPPPRCFN